MAICYRDQTFCSSDCVVTNCHRFFGEEQHAAATRWWGSEEYPIAMNDYSQTCAHYASPTNGDGNGN